MHPPKINPREVKTTSMLFEAVSKKSHRWLELRFLRERMWKKIQGYSSRKISWTWFNITLLQSTSQKSQIVFIIIWATKQTLLLSFKYWLFHRDPYFMVYEIISTYLARISSPINPKQPGELATISRCGSAPRCSGLRWHTSSSKRIQRQPEQTWRHVRDQT